MENEMTNKQYIKALIDMEELLYEKFRETQNMKNLKIIEMMSRGEVRCNNCKIKMRKIKNSFFRDQECETCCKSSQLEKNNRKDIYKFVNSKWKKTKYLHNGWWFDKN